MKDQNHIGLVFEIDYDGYERHIDRYQEFIKELKPLLRRFGRSGLPFNGGDLWHLSRGQIARYIQDYEQNDDSPSPEKMAEFKALLIEIGELAREYPECIDIPIIEGKPVLTDEFKEALRIPFTNSILTPGGERFYQKFLTAREAVNDLIQAGGEVGQHFALQPTGLKLLRIAE